ncbi:MAG: metal-sensitive transcriptional regulator [Planctomycetota bacterium]|jgi:DNA-binding FrmR family transcriptional regulator
MATNPDHSEVLSALRRIEGQVRGVQRMVDEKQYCIDILNQIAAVKGALGSVEKRILERHFQRCVKNAMSGDSEADTAEKIAEIMDLINKRIS